MSIVMIVDSAADYENSELENKGLVRVPLKISFDEESYLDGETISKEAFYEKLKKNPIFPKTSQPSPNDFLVHFKAARERGDSVIAILLSGTLSGTVQSAFIAKEMAEYDDIYIIDSLSAVTGLRMLADVAVRLRDEGQSAGEIVGAVTALIPRLRIIAIAQTLEYLYRGGRISKTKSRIGTAVHMKPIIEVDQQGAVCLKDKSLGMKRACNRLLFYFENDPHDERYPVYFPYADNSQNAEKLFAMVSERWPSVRERHLYNIGPTIGAHTGPGAFGLTYIARE